MADSKERITWIEFMWFRHEGTLVLKHIQSIQSSQSRGNSDKHDHKQLAYRSLATLMKQNQTFKIGEFDLKWIRQTQNEGFPNYNHILTNYISENDVEIFKRTNLDCF